MQIYRMGKLEEPIKPIFKIYFLKYTWEFLEVFSKGTLKHQRDPENANITAEWERQRLLRKN